MSEKLQQKTEINENEIITPSEDTSGMGEKELEELYGKEVKQRIMDTRYQNQQNWMHENYQKMKKQGREHEVPVFPILSLSGLSRKELEELGVEASLGKDHADWVISTMRKNEQPKQEQVEDVLDSNIEELGEQVQQQDENIQQNINTVVDPEKAEIMAYASKDKEEELVRAKDAALDAASKIGQFVIVNGQKRSYEDEANGQVERAEKARKDADVQSQSAADVYDRVQKL